MTNVVSIPKRDWRSGLALTKEGKVTKCVGNAVLLLSHGDWEGCLEYDEFSDRMYWKRAPPRLSFVEAPKAGTDLQDHHSVYVAYYLNKVEGVDFAESVLQRALETAARARTVHPVRDYLRGLNWDGVPRLATWLSTYMGAPQPTDELAAYHKHIGTLWMISAVARVMCESPVQGVKADYMIVFEHSGQGSGKSSAVEILAGEWLNDSLADLHSKDAMQGLRGSWIVELGELSALNRSEINAIKSFLTRRVDKYRRSYGHRDGRYPRQCVFTATTNNQRYLRDSTGNRRFWPVACGSTDVAALRRDRDQLWAEAFQSWDSGLQWHPTESMIPSLRNQQAARYDTHPWTDHVLKFVAMRDEPFTTADVLGFLVVPLDKWTRAAQTDVGAILGHAGYESKRCPTDADGKRPWKYFRDWKLQ